MAGASDNVIEQKDYSKFRISAGMGGGYRIDKVSDRLSPGEKDHVKKMKWGMNVEIDGEYYVSESIGIGFASSWFRSAATLTVNESGISSSIKDRINLFYLVPKIIFGGYKDQGWFVNASLGYLGYYQKLKGEKSSNKLTGGTLGGVYGFGYNISMTESISLFFKLSFTSGVLSKLTLTTGNSKKETIDFPKDEKEGLNRISLTVGVRFKSR
ncbi:MAG: hypothetical protein LBG19_12615 [Prevotellaceae bacterium]|nr:hypothetical protein [Prevotellaceae bacterium]